MAKAHFAYSNIDAMFKKHTYLVFPSKTIRTDGIKAGIMVRSPPICFASTMLIIVTTLVVVRFRPSRRYLLDRPPALPVRRAEPV